MPQNATPQAELSPQQVLAIEQLAVGATVVSAAEAAGVSRETVHRWNREDWAFQAAVNRARRDLQEAVERRLLAVAEKAMSNVSDAVDEGNLSASLSVLKGLGVLNGVAPRLGSDDPVDLSGEADLRKQETHNARQLRKLFAGA